MAPARLRARKKSTTRRAQIILQHILNQRIDMQSPDAKRSFERWSSRCGRTCARHRARGHPHRRRWHAARLHRPPGSPTPGTMCLVLPRRSLLKACIRSRSATEIPFPVEGPDVTSSTTCSYRPTTRAAINELFDFDARRASTRGACRPRRPRTPTRRVVRIDPARTPSREPEPALESAPGRTTQRLMMRNPQLNKHGELLHC